MLFADVFIRLADTSLWQHTYANLLSVLTVKILFGKLFCFESFTESIIAKVLFYVNASFRGVIGKQGYQCQGNDFYLQNFLKVILF